ncbi:MAG: dTDP-4-dehydrorhamnose 3,5-epimerase [Balneolaceae bacterium]|nr:MAG: dTDP-4-dehydrorhamnose 3,5-epimerase [Balneolaceae bacterium]
MIILNEPIAGLLVLQPRVFEDERGFFLETWQKETFRKLGVENDFVQDNWSRSEKGVLRGLHYQVQYPQGKLISVRSGSVFDVAVDIRRDSPTFGKWHGEVLSEENKLQVYVPPGFAHGFCVLSDNTDFTYKCTDYYHPEDEAGIRWDDPDLKIGWPVKDPTVSDKDRALPLFREI